MMSLQEIIGDGIDASKLSPAKLDQCKDLQRRVNIIRMAWNHAMNSTSGVRTWAHHTDIYKEKAQNHLAPFEDGVYDESLVPKRSKHLDIVEDCAAVDIADDGLKLTDWLKHTPEGQKAIEDADVWCEDGNTNWWHCQNKAFGSYVKGGSRWFKP